MGTNEQLAQVVEFLNSDQTITSLSQIPSLLLDQAEIQIAVSASVYVQYEFDCDDARINDDGRIGIDMPN